jgi:sugar phosphate isomerase/epimerase
MGFAGADWLEREGREAEQRPDEVIRTMGLRDGSVVADLGCGTGRAIPALRRASTAHAFQEMGKLLGDLAERCRAEGMRLHYHNHHFEFALLDGRYALDWLFDAAGPYLSFEPDLAWVAAAGVDPVALLRRFSGRCPLIHAKDLAPSGERPEDAVMDGFVMSDVGHGTLDWSTLLPATRVAGAEWYIVEHDNPRDPMGSITRSLAYLRGVLPDVLD